MLAMTPPDELSPPPMPTFYRLADDGIDALYRAAGEAEIYSSSPMKRHAARQPHSSNATAIAPHAPF